MNKLGGIKSPYSYRDIKLGRVQAPIEVPKELIPDYSMVEKYYQGKQPACSAHAGTFAIGLFEYLESGSLKKLSPRYMWRKIKDIDGYAIEVGSDLRSIMKVLASKATCVSSLLPNDVDTSMDIYANPSITDAMDHDAQPRIIKSYAFMDDLSFFGIKQAIAQNKLAILLIWCDEGFFNTQYPTFTKKKYGHFVCCIGYTKDAIIIVDSTEKDFRKSVKYIGIEYLDFIREGGTMVDIPNKDVEELTKKIKLLHQLVNLYTKLYKLWKNS